MVELTVGSRVLRILSTRHARIVAAAILLVVGGFFIPQAHRRMTRSRGNDLTVYLASGQALMHGDNPYAIPLPQGHAPYPLTVDALLIPLTWVPTGLAQAVWFATNAGALLASLLLLEHMWGHASGSVSLASTVPLVVRIALVVVAFLVPFQSHFTLGQMDLVVLGLCCLFFRAHLAGRYAAASMWLGAAIAMKLTPLAFVVGVARRRQYRTLALTAGWAVLWAIGLPALVSDRVLALYGDAWMRVLRSRVEIPVSLWESRFTLAGALAYVWPRSATVPGLRYWAAAAVLAPIAVAEGRVGSASRGRLMVFAATLVAIPLISPISETHHLAILAGALWLWMLAAGSPPFMPALDLGGAVLFLAAHWVGLGLAGPGASRRVSLFDFLALLILYLVLLRRSLGFAQEPSFHAFARPAARSTGSPDRGAACR